MLTISSLQQKFMEKSKYKNTIMFADTCFAGDMSRKRTASNTYKERMNIMLFLSSHDNKVYIESSKMSN